MSNTNYDNNRNYCVLWTQDPSIFFRNANYLNFIPNSQMNYCERYNSISLLLIYIIIILLLIGKSDLIYIPLLLIIVYIVLNSQESNETFTTNHISPTYFETRIISDNGQYIVPEYRSKNRSRKRFRSKFGVGLGNIKLSDDNRSAVIPDTISNFSIACSEINDVIPIVPVIPAALNADDDDVNEIFNAPLNPNLFKTVDELFEDNNYERTINSTPNYNIATNQNEFAQFLYGNNQSSNCKVNQLQCLRYENLKMKDRIFNPK